MPGLDDLYREIILDHYKNPRNRGELDTPPAVVSEGFNPLCGDEIKVYVLIDGDRVADLRFVAQGCSVSQSSASMMTQMAKGKTLNEVADLVHAFKSMLSVNEHDERHADGAHHDHGPSGDHPHVSLGDLQALQGVMKFPTRIKCATLAWNTMAQAIADSGGA
jgi:nitrogen fixation protein NifU and related proteins